MVVLEGLEVSIEVDVIHYDMALLGLRNPVVTVLIV